MSSTNILDFTVHREYFGQIKWVEKSIDLQEGQVLLKVNKFAFTANNITYALLGEVVSYWKYFPTGEDFGIIPAWGFADVVHSDVEDLAEGERFYGYFPMSSHLVVQPESVKASSFIDGASHRKDLFPTYNQYWRVANDPNYDKRFEDHHVLLFPLFVTSFLLDDFLADNDFFGAQTVILSSASSKMAYGTAFLLNRNRNQRSPYEVIGLTSSGNMEFVEKLGCHDRVVSYDAIQSLSQEKPVMYVDMAGNGELRKELHHHFQDHMKCSLQVGASHWDKSAPTKDLPGAKPELFFAPSQHQKRVKEWGAAEFQKGLGEIWKEFLVPAQDKIKVVSENSMAAIESIYLEMLEGNSEPDLGYIFSIKN